MLNGNVVFVTGACLCMGRHDVRDERSVEASIRDVMSMNRRSDQQCRSRAGCEAAQS